MVFSLPSLASPLWLLVLLFPLCCRAEVYIVRDDDPSGALMEVPDAAATFGQSLGDNGLRGRLIQAHPLNGCKLLDPPPFSPNPNDAMIAVMSRYGGCNFADKVRFAQEAGFNAAIIYNVNSNKLVPMGGDDHSKDLIPSVFIGQDDADVLMRKFLFPDHSQFFAIVTAVEPFDINAYLLPFAIVVAICFLVMLFVVCYKCFQDCRRARRHRLPRSALKKIPVVKFKTGDSYETCVICLDDFVEGDKLRVLPCDHGYHQKCIDPWLLKTKRICPQCRRRVFSRRNQSELATPSEAGESSDTETDERAPLIRRQGPRDRNRGGGTFSTAANRTPSNRDLLIRAEQQRRLNDQIYMQQQAELRRRRDELTRPDDPPTGRNRRSRHRNRNRQQQQQEGPPQRGAVAAPVDGAVGGSLPPTFVATVETHGVPDDAAIIWGADQVRGGIASIVGRDVVTVEASVEQAPAVEEADVAAVPEVAIQQMSTTTQPQEEQAVDGEEEAAPEEQQQGEGGADGEHNLSV